MIETSVFADEVSADFEEAVDLSVRAGARCLELRGGIWGRAVQNCTDEDVKRMLEVLERYGARVAVIGSPVGKCTLGDDEGFDQHLRWFDRMCELARAFGTRPAGPKRKTYFSASSLNPAPARAPAKRLRGLSKPSSRETT